MVAISIALDADSARLAGYAARHTTPPDDHLTAIADETRASLPMPEMLTGIIEGRLLETLVFVLKPRLVIDLGTYSGYSALAMAAALEPGAKVITCERSSRLARVAERNFDASPHGDRIELRKGPALDTLATLEGPFDLVFIDADKGNYWLYYEAALAKLSERGLIVVDNTLWGGRVADETDHDHYTAVMREFNDRLLEDPRTVSVMLTVRDGVTLVRRAC
jgi:predicted O-methyltransferase YrrM